MKTTERTTITVIAAGGVVAFLAAFNLAGWVVTWENSIALMVLFAGVALCAEVLGFNLAVSIERQWRDKRRAPALAAAFSLAVCAAINLTSGHNAWLEFERLMFAPQVRAEQTEIDARRANLQIEIAAIDAQLDAARPPIRMEAGPQGRAEARRVYEMEVARLAPQRDAAQAKLDAAPITAPARHIAPDWSVWVLFGLIEAMKATVLWAIGAGLSRTDTGPAGAAGGADTLSTAANTPPQKRRPIDPAVAEEIAYLREVDKRLATVWRVVKGDRRSFRGAAKELNVTLAMVQRRIRSAEQALAKRNADRLEAQGVSVIGKAAIKKAAA